MLRQRILRMTEAFRTPRSGARQALQLAGGTAISQALGVAALPAIARLYDPADVGTFGLFVAFTSVAMNVANARFEQAIPGARTDEEAMRLVRLSIVASLPMSLLLVLAFAIMRQTNVLGYGELPAWAVWWSIPAVLALGLLGALRYWCVRMSEFPQLARMTVAQGAARAILPIALAPLRLGAGSLVISEIASRLVGARWLLSTAITRLGTPPTGWRAELRDSAVRWRRFPLVLLPSTLIDSLTIALPVPLIAHAYGPSAAGVLVLVQRIAAAPSALVSASVADVFHARVGSHSVDTPASVSPLLRRTMVRLAIIGAAILVPAALLAPVALPALFGDGWDRAGWVFVIIAPWTLAAWIVAPVSRVLTVSARMELKLVYDFTALALLLGTSFACTRAEATFYQCLAMMSASQVVAYALYAVVLTIAARSPGSHAQ